MLEKEKFVLDKIHQKEYTLLPVSVATGLVFKVNTYGNMEEDGFERGFLYLPKGSGIKEHSHIFDIEKYDLIMGDLKVNGEAMSSNICDLGCRHGIDIVNTDTIIETCKISDKYLLCGYHKNIESLFDLFSRDNFLDEYNAKNKTYIK